MNLAAKLHTMTDVHRISRERNMPTARLKSAQAISDLIDEARAAAPGMGDLEWAKLGHAIKRAEAELRRSVDAVVEGVEVS